VHRTYLVLVRHGKSKWNKKGQWTGWKDIALAPEGIEEAKNTASQLQDFALNTAFTSELIRAKQTLEVIKKDLKITIPTLSSTALNERHYGIYTGKNKWDIESKIGEEKFKTLRRAWDYPIKNGESLKDVYARVVPYYDKTIAPVIRNGKNTIIVAHGNSLRALIKYLENISDNDIEKLEIGTAEAWVYTLHGGNVTYKEIRSKNTQKV